MGYKLIRILIFLFISSSLGTAFSQPIQHCGDLAQISDSMAEHNTNAKIIKEISSPNVKLIVIGETHYKNYFFKLYDLLKKLNVAKKSKACLFSEISENMNRLDIQQALNGQYNEIFFSRTRLNFAHQFKKFSDEGWKVIPVDKKMTPKEVVAFPKTMSWYAERDDIMLKNISKAFNNNSCDFGVLLVGSLHIQSKANYQSLGKKIKNSLGIDNRIIDTIIPQHLPLSCTGFQLYSFSSFISEINNFNSNFVKPHHNQMLDADYTLFLNPIHEPQLIGQPANKDNPFWSSAGD